MILKLCLGDLKHERLLSLCAVAALVAVIAPLLLLFSLRYGIVSSMEHDLKANPLNLEIKMLQGYTLHEEFFKILRADPHTAFAVEMTRSLSVTADVSANHKAKSGAECIPTANGDPLFAYSGIKDLQDDESAVISAALAEDLGCTSGDTLRIAVPRVRGGKNERAVASFKITGILKASLATGYKLYLTVPAITAMEDFRDGYEPLIFSDGSFQNRERQSYAKVRLYAKDLDSVEYLSKKLRQDFQIADKLSEIEDLKALTRVLNFIFTVIAAVSSTGGFAAVGGLMLAMAARKERALCSLRISGLSDHGVILMLVFENVILGSLAFLFSVLLYLLGSWLFANYFAPLLSEHNAVSVLTFGHFCSFYLVVLSGCAALSFLIARYKVLAVPLSMALRRD